jgi:hypothetical protein
MTANRLELVGLSVLVLTLTATVSLAQNTSNPLLSGNTVNPVERKYCSPRPSSPSLSVDTKSEPGDWNESVYGPALLRATDNRQPLSNSVISERLRATGHIWLLGMRAAGSGGRA